MSSNVARKWALALGSLSLLVLAAPTSAQVPDVYVYDIGVDGGDTNDIHYYGQSGGIAGYSIATQSCNKGTAVLIWNSGSSVQHPVISQNMFRLKDGQFDHIGQSWLKHGFCAVNETETLCGPCNSTPCSTLGVGCADTYWATLNDGQSGQSKVNVNATSGSHVHGGGPSGNGAIRGRLQVAVSDMDPAQNVGAEYFIEGHYITADDAAAGNSANNASYRRINVNSVSNITGGGPTIREKPAIYAWQDSDSGVTIRPIINLEGAGAKTTYFLAYRVTNIGGGQWHYEYAVQNLNSDQSAGSFSLAVNPTAVISNIGFNDVSYHSGDPYDGTDWPGIQSGGEISWATTPHSTNVNANAIRWGTIYSFRFDSTSAPGDGQATLGLFKPGASTEIVIDDVLVPAVVLDFDKFKPGNTPSGPTTQGPVVTPFTSGGNGKISQK